MTEASFAELLSREQPLILPVAHDALSARLIQRAGFSAAAIGGFGVIGCRLGLPDVGLASFGEIASAVRDIALAINLPLIVDADDGYGDVKNVVRTVRTYEQMGTTGIVVEDQASPKRCGHMNVERRLISTREAAAKLVAALGARARREFAIIARTDARSVEGLEAALERGRAYEAVGVDALFVEAPTSVAELETIGRSFSIPLVVNAAEAGRTPILSPIQYRDLGFSIVLYPSTLLLRMIKTMRETLATLRAGSLPADDLLPTFPELADAMGLAEWSRIDDEYGPPRT